MNYVYWLEFFGVMLSTIVVDICWAFYFIKIHERKSIVAGFWAMMVVLFGAITTVGYMNNFTFLIAALIGSFIGTALTVEYEKRRSKKGDKG